MLTCLEILRDKTDFLNIKDHKNNNDAENWILVSKSVYSQKYLDSSDSLC